jgi:hypothetical protein
MTPEELKKLRELCEKATPGPWPMSAVKMILKDAAQDGRDVDADAYFIEAARTAMPALIDYIEALTNPSDGRCMEIGALRDEVERLHSIDTEREELIDECEKTLDLFAKENARLRAALEEIAEEPNRIGLLADEIIEEYPVIKAWHIAREALGGGDADA